MPRKLPKQKPGRSKQDYGTPPEFMRAIEHRFGKVTFDLAASPHNAKAERYFALENGFDSLKQNWKEPELGGVRWLNPPFSDIEPWAAKCAECRWLPVWTLLLTPASIGSLWYARHVLRRGHVDGISRITFVGETTPYPKDLMLSCFGFGVSGNGFWQWNKKEE
jgi:DNA (cytosine-5)-methyltransferase 1